MSEKRESGHTLDYWLLRTAVITTPFVLLMYLLCPSVMPFGLFEFWTWSGFLSGILAGWPFYIWAVVGTLALGMFRNVRITASRSDVLAYEFLTSLRAGVCEEIIFRWLLFLSAIVAAKFFNVILLGLPYLVHWYVTAPVLNFFMAFQLGWLLYGMGWAVGAGAIAANTHFRDGHRYLGVIGYCNSWIAGWFLFYVMFTYGLPAVIAVHFLYDLIIGLTITVAFVRSPVHQLRYAAKFAE